MPCVGRFSPIAKGCQDGYRAFSFSKSQRDIVIKYIMNQEADHRVKTFKEEDIKMLSDFDVA